MQIIIIMKERKRYNVLKCFKVDKKNNVIVVWINSCKTESAILSDTKTLFMITCQVGINYSLPPSYYSPRILKSRCCSHTQGTSMK